MSDEEKGAIMRIIDASFGAIQNALDTRRNDEREYINGARVGLERNIQAYLKNQMMSNQKPRIQPRVLWIGGWALFMAGLLLGFMLG